MEVYSVIVDTPMTMCLCVSETALQARLPSTCVSLFLFLSAFSPSRPRGAGESAGSCLSVALHLYGFIKEQRSASEREIIAVDDGKLLNE